MDEKGRARLRALCEAATPGPWATYMPAAGGLGIAHGDPRTQHGCIARMVSGSPADAALMGIARTAIPALIDEIDVVTHERDEARAEVQRLRAAIDAALSTLHTAPGQVCAASWYVRLVETLRNALTTGGGL